MASSRPETGPTNPAVHIRCERAQSYQLAGTTGIPAADAKNHPFGTTSYSISTALSEAASFLNQRNGREQSINDDEIVILDRTTAVWGNERERRCTGAVSLASS